nr:MAG TPA: hypothetical protein [Crassvirales sp.]
MILRHCTAIASINVDPPSKSIIKLLSNCANADVFDLLSLSFLS